MIVIDARYCGPPGSGNGGYVAGVFAAYVDAPAALVRLRRPPPIGTPLAVREAEIGLVLADGDVVVAEARPTTVEIEPPAPPTRAEAEAAARRFTGFGAHPYPGCFVCGTERRPADGLRIFPGPVEGRDLVAAPWIPDASLGAEDGTVRPEFLWAALDCPGGFAFPPPPSGAFLLGELRVALSGAIAVGEPCVVVGWEIGHEGRKHHTATALYGESGACRGLGLATWIEVKAASTPGA